MCREGAWDELAVGVTSGIAIRSGMLVKKSCRTDNDCLLYTAFFISFYKVKVWQCFSAYKEKMRYYEKFCMDNGQNAKCSRVSSERSQGIYECTYKSADGSSLPTKL